MVLNNTEKTFIKLISSSISGNSFSYKDEIDWKGIFEYARLHDVFALIYENIKDDRNNANIDKYEKNNLFNEYIKLSKMQFKYEKKACEIQKILTANNVNYFFLKGMELKNIYPKARMRSIRDIDIFAPDQNKEKTEELLKKIGFYYNDECEYHSNYVDNEGIKIEIHSNLLALGMKANKYFKNKSSFLEEDKILYLVAHLAKHFIAADISIKHVLDIYLYTKKYGNIMDFNYLNEELDKIGLRTFYNKIIQKAENWICYNEAMFDDVDKYIIIGGKWAKIPSQVRININILLSRADIEEKEVKDRIRKWKILQKSFAKHIKNISRKRIEKGINKWRKGIEKWEKNYLKWEKGIKKWDDECREWQKKIKNDERYIISVKIKDLQNEKEKYEKSIYNLNKEKERYATALQGLENEKRKYDEYIRTSDVEKEENIPEMILESKRERLYINDVEHYINKNSDKVIIVQKILTEMGLNGQYL